MLNKPKEGEKREQFESLAKKKKIIWLFSWSFTLGQTAVAVINICITSWDLYPWRELNCHRQSWASKNSSRQAGRLAGWLAGRQPTLPLSPLDLISPEEALPPPTTPNYAPLWHCVCGVCVSMSCMGAEFLLTAHNHRRNNSSLLRKCLHRLILKCDPIVFLTVMFKVNNLACIHWLMFTSNLKK